MSALGDQSPTRQVPVAQHIVTRAILDTFVGPSPDAANPRAGRGRVTVYDLRAKEVNWRPTAGKPFFVDNFIRHEADRAEQRWGEVERRLPAVYAAIGSGVGLSTPGVEETIRDLLAIHWIRNEAVRTKQARIHSEVVVASKSELASRPGVVEDLYQNRPDLELENPEGRAAFIDRLHSGFVSAAEAHWSNSAERLYGAVRTKFAQYGLEILHPQPGCEFIISDGALVTSGQPSPHSDQGFVALGDATAFFMPISPTTLISLRTGDSAETSIAKELVNQLNAKQANAARRWLACRPGSAPDVQFQRLRHDLATARSKADHPAP